VPKKRKNQPPPLTLSRGLQVKIFFYFYASRPPGQTGGRSCPSSLLLLKALAYAGKIFRPPHQKPAENHRGAGFPRRAFSLPQTLIFKQFLFGRDNGTLGSVTRLFVLFTFLEKRLLFPLDFLV